MQESKCEIYLRIMGVHHMLTNIRALNIFYINILFICQQVFDMDLHGIHIKFDRGNKIYDDASTLKVLSMHEGEEKVYLCINVDLVIDLVTIKIC